ncbi:MAG: PilN domain-containing protein [Deltaproteobacteria bacterium]|nr:PilN domain-containing protein [Deltaproteobacteria bacterium]MBW2136277.1 PilN domain-containing protein [Deltaproteobacteria bacterium]
MIKINLLPFREARKKENIRRQITIYCLTTALLFTVMIYYFLQLNSTIGSLREDEKNVNAELARYQKTVSKINQLEKKIKEINAKLNVIKELEKNKTGPVHLLEEITYAVPRDKLWLSSLKESGGKLTLTGTAMDNETVALFMTNLERSEYINSVELQSTRMRSLPQYKLRVSDFVLECRTYAFKEAVKPQPKKGRRK